MNTNKKIKPVQNGFTLIEILVVIGMISLLAAIVLIAINPARQFAQGRNAQRQSNIETILNAIGQNMADNKGIFTCTSGNDITTTAKTIASSTGDLDLRSCLVPTYIAEIPVDPKSGTACADSACAAGYNTKYTVEKNAQDRIKVCTTAVNTETALGTSPAELCITR